MCLKIFCLDIHFVRFVSKLATRKQTRDRCYDFLNIFAEKFCAKNWCFFAQNKAKLCKNWIITLIFEKNAIFSPKIAANCDHNIDPRIQKCRRQETFGLGVVGKG
jgi:hypothetical protein